MLKFWNNMPIAKKLMAVTILVFFAFCLMFFVGQIAFFEKYYTHVKLSEVKKVASDFAQSFDKSDDSADIAAKMAELSDAHDCYLMVLDSDGAIRHILSYVMEVVTNSGETVQLSLDNAAHDKNFMNMGLKVGDSVEISYFSADAFNPARIFFPLGIKSGDKEWQIFSKDKTPPRQREPRHNDEREDRKQFSEWSATGTIKSMVLPTGQNRNLNAERADASKAAMEWLGIMDKDELESGSIISYYYTDEETEEKYSVAVKSLGSADAGMIFVITPLNMVRKAADVATNAYYFWFLFAMAGACVLGIVFSKVVTRPVVEMTDITKKMAALDFSRKCDYSANDEMGQLADNINHLSDTLDMTIQQLKEDIRRERAVEKSRREFVAAASHELKTPLGVIRAYTEAIIDGVSETKQSRYMQVIVDETEKMDRLILDMLDNSRLESGAQKMNPAMHDICALMRQMTKRFEAVMNQRAIVQTLSLDCEKIEKQFDIDMIERVLTNFITNALRNTPDGGRVEYLVKKEADGAVSVSVENSGSHIDEADYEFIWDRFYKADKSRRRSAGGTGLGLSIAKNILIMHGAQYGAENTKDGVKFYFTLK